MSTHLAAQDTRHASKTRTQLRDDTPSARSSSGAETAFSLIAVAALAVVFALAFTNDVRPSPADRVTLLLLALLGAAFFWTPLLRVFVRDTNRNTTRTHDARDDSQSDASVDESRREASKRNSARREEAASFALSLAMFVVYGMARAAGPNGEDVWSLHFGLLPETPFPVSWATRVVVVGALLTIPLWIRHLNGWTRAVLCALGIVALFGIASFSFLRGFYPVGEADAVLDPKPLADTIFQVVEYASLALLCSASCAAPQTRRLVLRVLPLLLLALWARHQFFPAPPPPEDAE